MIKNPLITTSLALTAFAAVGSAAKPTFPSSKKDTIRKLLKIPTNEDLLGRMLQPTQCVIDTLTLTTTGDYGSLFDTYFDEVNEPFEKDPSSVCALSYEKAICYLDGSALLETAAPICTGLGGTIGIFAIVSKCPEEDGFVTETYIGLPGCLAPSCSSVEDFIDNIDPSLLPSDDDPDDEEDPCELSLDYWYPEKLYCTEDKTNEFELKEGNMKTCGWLSRRDRERKAKICVDKPQAAEACPKSCCMCKENPRTRFFKKMNKRTGEVVTKPCRSLDKYMNTEMKMKVCNKSGGGGFPSARASCPQSCETCPDFESTPDILLGSGVVNGEECNLVGYYERCDPFSMPEGLVCAEGEGDTLYCSYGVADYACAICLDEDVTDDETADDDQPEINYGSGAVNGESCSVAAYYDGVCDSSLQSEGSICFDDGSGYPLYCSYDISDSACAICLDGMDFNRKLLELKTSHP